MAPFVQLMLDEQGNHSPCAVLDGLWKDKQDLWNHTDLEQLRNNHANNIRDPLCKSCWDDEDNGIESYRQRFHDANKFNMDQAIASIENKTYHNGPLVLYLKNGNICNLQCRICGPKDSFSWIPEAKQHVDNYPNEIEGTMMNMEPYKKNWTTSQLVDLLKWNDTVIRIDHFGGEALTNPQVLRYLEMLIEEGVAHKITLYFNTNASRVPNNEWWHILSQFKGIDFQLSLDGIEKQFEYQRHPAKWENVLNFREWIKEKSNTMPIRYGIIITVNNMNVWYLPETVDYFMRYKKQEVIRHHPEYLSHPHILKRLVQLEDYIYINSVYFPNYYCIQNMPDKLKRTVDVKLMSSEYNPKFKEIVKFMWLQTDKQLEWHKFLAWTKRHDAYRKQSFAQTFTDWHELIHNDAKDNQ